MTQMNFCIVVVVVKKPPANAGDQETQFDP